MAQHKLILVTGATGQQGRAVARALLGRGQRIRVLTRSLARASEFVEAGAEGATGDLTERLSLERALQGVEAVFAMSTPFEAGAEAEIRQGTVLAEAVKASGV